MFFIFYLMKLKIGIRGNHSALILNFCQNVIKVGFRTEI